MHNRMVNRKNQHKKCLNMKGITIFVAMLTGLSILCIFLYDVLIALPYFKTKDIQISGQQLLSKNDILAWVQLSPQENIVAVRTNNIKKRLIHHPWISQATISRTFPNRLSIEIVEKQPLAIVLFDRPLIIDTNGYVIKEKDKSDFSAIDNLPIITGMAHADLSQPGDPLSKKMIAIVRVLAKKKQTIGFSKNIKISQLHVDIDFGITIWIGDSEYKIFLGLDNYQKKFQRLSKLLTFFRYRKAYQRIEFIDMNNLDRIVVRPYSDKNSDGKEV